MTSNNDQTSQGKSRGKFTMVVAVIAALAVLGLLLSQMDGRIAIVTSGGSTATNTADLASVSVTAQPNEITKPAPTSIPNLQGQRLEMCGSDICIVSSDGQSIPLGLATSHQIYPGFGFSPDGSKIVFNACLKTELQENPAYEFCHELFISDRNGNVTRLTNIHNIPETDPSWSPDGEWIIFGGWSLSIIQPDGTGMTTLVSDPAVGNVYASAWSPNSEQIAFISGRYDFNINWGFQNVVSIINKDGSGWRTIFILPEPKPIQEDWITEIAWSPDGQSLALVFDDGRAHLIDVNCEAGKEGCGISNLNTIPEFPQNWLDTFSPQWAGASQSAFAASLSPHGEQARAFAEPILIAIANMPPDFADDFSTDRPGWQIDTFDGQCGQITEGRLRTNIIPEQMTLQSDGRYTCGAHNPNALNVTNFVFEVDLMQAQAEVQGVAGVQWRHADGYYRVAVDVPGTHWTLERSSTSHPSGASGETLQEWDGPASGLIRVIGRDNQFAVYIHATPVFYVEDDLNPSGEIDLWLNAPDGPVTVEYDNVKLWNLDNVKELQTSETQARAFAEPILQAIANRAPDFEDDFTANTGWQVNDYDGSGLDQMAIENGQLRLFMGGPRDLTHVSHPAVRANDFVLVVDAILETPGWVDAPGIGWRNTAQGAHSFVVWTNRIWETRYCDSKGCEPNYIVGDPGKIVTGEPMQMMVIAKGTGFALYLNGKPLAYVDDPNRLPGADITLFAHSNATNQSAVITFDNLKFWNLDNVPGLP